MKKYPYKIATTSFIYPSTVGDNCIKLEKIVDEVSIVLFETKASLNYSREDLPLCLKELNLSYNVHLPLDLPWDRPPELVVDIILRLMDKVNFLNPNFYVLHPPNDGGYLLRFLYLLEKNKCPLWMFCMENIRGNSLLDIWEIILQKGLSVCLDLGHILEYNQLALLSAPHLYSRTRVLHLYSPKGSLHGSLKDLTEEGKEMLKKIFSNITKKTTVVIEVFNEKDLMESLDFLWLWFKEGMI